MANAVYPYFRAQLARKVVDMVNDTLVAYLVDLADYTYSASHQTLADLPAGARVANVTLTGKTVSDAALFDAADVTFPTVSGDVSEAIIIVRSTGVESTSELAMYFDTGVGNLPVTPNGGNIPIQWNASGILQL